MMNNTSLLCLSLQKVDPIICLTGCEPGFYVQKVNHVTSLNYFCSATKFLPQPLLLPCPGEGGRESANTRQLFLEQMAQQLFKKVGQQMLMKLGRQMLMKIGRQLFLSRWYDS